MVRLMVRKDSTNTVRLLASEVEARMCRFPAEEIAVRRELDVFALRAEDAALKTAALHCGL